MVTAVSLKSPPLQGRSRWPKVKRACGFSFADLAGEPARAAAARVDPSIQAVIGEMVVDRLGDHRAEPGDLLRGRRFDVEFAGLRSEEPIIGDGPSCPDEMAVKVALVAFVIWRMSCPGDSDAPPVPDLRRDLLEAADPVFAFELCRQSDDGSPCGDSTRMLLGLLGCIPEAGYISVPADLADGFDAVAAAVIGDAAGSFIDDARAGHVGGAGRCGATSAPLHGSDVYVEDSQGGGFLRGGRGYPPPHSKSKTC